MLEKAAREYARMCDSLDIDNVFNYFVTAYHISDYIKKSNLIEQSVLDHFLSDPEIKLSHDLCDKGKHMRLTKRPDPRTQIVKSEWGVSAFGQAPWGGVELWLLIADGKSINVKVLGKDVLEKWTDFFQRNGL